MRHAGFTWNPNPSSALNPLRTCSSHFTHNMLSAAQYMYYTLKFTIALPFTAFDRHPYAEKLTKGVLSLSVNTFCDVLPEITLMCIQVFVYYKLSMHIPFLFLLWKCSTCSVLSLFLHMSWLIAWKHAFGQKSCKLQIWTEWNSFHLLSYDLSF